jgi:hypothetical protein
MLDVNTLQFYIVHILTTAEVELHKALRLHSCSVVLLIFLFTSNSSAWPEFSQYEVNVCSLFICFTFPFTGYSYLLF